jgi:hypothetical protein
MGPPGVHVVFGILDPGNRFKNCCVQDKSVDLLVFVSRDRDHFGQPFVICTAYMSEEYESATKRDYMSH